MSNRKSNQLSCWQPLAANTRWLVAIIKDLYSDISSNVKWLGDCSDRFPDNQGVRQGGILSTPLYKVYVHLLLDILKNRRLGFRLGTVYIASPAVADDVAYLARLKYELQLMLGEGSEYSARNRYQIHPTKTIVAMLPGKAEDSDLWTLGDNYAQVTHSQIGHQISHGYDPAALVAIHIGP